MRRIGLSVVLVLLAALPAWGWSRHASAARERDASLRSLMQARANVNELTQAAGSPGAVLEAIPEAEIVSAVNQATTDAGLPLSTIRELSVRVEDVRSSSGASSVQRTQISLLAVAPESLGLLLKQLDDRLPTAVPTSIRVTHANARNTADANRFDTLLVLEQVVLSGDSGDGG
ncbi:MAG: hypothetical protein AAF085_09760 [Planctomycetota bacterium]